MAGGNIIVLQRILGHSDIRVTMRYSHFAPDHLQDAIHFNPLARFESGDKVAVNTDRLIPNNLATHLDRYTARILDLLSVKDYDLLDSSTYEFIVYRPPEDEPTYSKSQFSKLNEALFSIQEVDDKHSIRVVPVTTVHQAASRIIKAENQAA